LHTSFFDPGKEIGNSVGPWVRFAQVNEQALHGLLGGLLRIETRVFVKGPRNPAIEFGARQVAAGAA
jgi:hypothetical protein